MEWVETTGRTLEEAKDAALDQLGVAEADAEFDVVEEARSGLFGRLRSEARVRARVRPTTPRPKAERGGRRRKAADGAATAAAPATAPAGDAAEADVEPRAARPARSSSRPARPEPSFPEDEGEELPLEEQGEIARSFVAGLVEAFGAEATTEVVHTEDDALEVQVRGDDLGLLIGPKGDTLNAVQDLARTVLLRSVGAGRGARLRVDIGGYRERRREALARFTRQVAEEVLRTGQATALEAMPPPDRKVVHDTAGTVDGVRTTSDGEEPHRRVLVLPDDS